MLLRLFLLFTIVPIIELALLIQIGQWIGPLWAIALVLTTGLVGAWLAKREGFAVLRQLRDELKEGLPPGSRLMEGALVVAGGLFLVTPGVLTDLAGFTLIFPATRRFMAPRVLAWLLRRFQIDTSRFESIQRERSQRERSQRAPEEPLKRDPHFDHPVRE